jgi:DNA-binding NtrC family response regulator
MILLALESENGAVLTYRLNKSQFTVGSSSKNDVVVRSPGIADRHLVMQRSGASFTFVTTDRQTVVLNGERRSRGVLNPGDRVRMGSMTLIFRGSDAVPDALSEEAAPALRSARAAADSPVLLSDPAGFGPTRARLLELFETPPSDCFQRLVALIREALPGVEVAVLLPGEGDDPVPLASVWTGKLPRPPARILAELAAPGRYAQLAAGDAPAIVAPVVVPGGEIVAVLAARPVGALGSEGVGLICEAARVLGLRWRDIGRDRAGGGTWEAEARQRLEVDLPGSSQAAQVLRTGMLAAAYGSDPVLVCGAEGVGRTEVARLLGTVSRRGNGRVVVIEGRDGEDAIRDRLFGPSGHASLAPGGDGAVGRAAGTTLVIRNVDAAPVGLQAELAGLISARQHESSDALPTRWVITCGENPLALVQQGKLAGALLQVFSHFMLRVPRLAERREDLPLLIAGLMRRVAREQEKQLRGLTLECLNSMLAQPFPGEMAELVREINRLVTATPDGEMVRCERLTGGDSTIGGREPAPEVTDVLASDNLKVTVPKVERLLIDRVMRRAKGNQSRGAQTLGISRGALIAKLKEYGIPDYRHLKRAKSRP